MEPCSTIRKPRTRDIAIEEACSCPSGRLVIIDNATGKVIEPEFEVHCH